MTSYPERGQLVSLKVGFSCIVSNWEGKNPT